LRQHHVVGFYLATCFAFLYGIYYVSSHVACLLCLQRAFYFVKFIKISRHIALKVYPACRCYGCGHGLTNDALEELTHGEDACVKLNVLCINVRYALPVFFERDIALYRQTAIVSMGL